MMSDLQRDRFGRKMMSDLPRDMTEEVLSRLPVTSLREVRSTCKKWNTLNQKSKLFKEAHCK
ncbi:unnamed protein product [Arabidopsis lyrata]|nr:unnamed protein product [Arabidopsis lyrata]